MRFDIPYQHHNASGIYAILNLVNCKVYVGSASNFAVRYRNHLSKLLKTKHHCIGLQRAITKYGIENFAFTLLQLCDIPLLTQKEQHWFDKFDVVKKGYNSSPIAGNNTGIKRTDEVKAKYSLAKRGVKRAPLSEDTKAKISAANKGEKRSPEVIQQLSAKRKGKQLSETHKRNISASLKGHKTSGETRKKISENQKGAKRKPLPEQTKRKISEAHKGKKKSEDTKQKMKLAAQRRPPEYMAKMLVTRRERHGY